MTSSATPALLTLGIISDIHSGRPAHFDGELRKLGQHALPLLDSFVCEMNELPDLDAVIHLGDAIEDSSPEIDIEQYDAVMKRLGALEAPVYHVTGNHDAINVGGDKLAELRGACGSFPAEIAGITLLSVETFSDDEHCWAEASGIAELGNQLRTGFGPVIVFSHHPLGSPSLTGNKWFQNLPHLALVEERDEIQRLISDSGRVLAAINGHCHWNELHHRRGVAYLTLQSLTENVAVPEQEPHPAAAWGVLRLFSDHSSMSVSGADPIVHRLPRENKRG